MEHGECVNCDQKAKICDHGQLILCHSCLLNLSEEARLEQRQLYYTNCFYCFIEGRQFDIEWDDMDEVIGYGFTAIKIGQLDAQQGMDKFQRSTNANPWRIMVNMYNLYCLGYDNPNMDVPS